jgi:hypothetical protein
MIASEYIKRIQDLIEVVGDVEVIIETPDELYEEAQAESQNVIPVCFDSSSGKRIWTSDFKDGDQRVKTFIRVW